MSIKHILPFAILSIASLQAADPAAAPPKPGNAISADEALERLKAGNLRYVSGSLEANDFSTEREALAKGQNPYAIILGCADSRVAPELAFDEERGDLFVVRVAGNFVNDDNLASIEYAVKFLGTPLIVVLGHESCGAVDAAVKVVTQDAELPGHLPGLIESIEPAVEAVEGKEGDLLANAIGENVSLNVKELQESTPILAEAVKAGDLQVVGAVYNLDSGKVEFQ